MAKVKQLQLNNEDIYPVTHESAVVDSNGTNLTSKLSKMSQLSVNFAKGDTVEESLEWLDNNGDKTLIYVLPDGYVYSYMETYEKSGENVLPNLEPLPGITKTANGLYYGLYATSSSPFYSADENCTITGMIPYTKDNHPTIYIKGVHWDSTSSHSRILIMKTNGVAYSTWTLTNTDLLTRFNLVALGDNYYKLESNESFWELESTNNVFSSLVFSFDVTGGSEDIIVSYTPIDKTVPNFTNQIPNSTGTSGTIYNGIGYKTDTYISGGADGTRTGVVATGFIPIGTGSSMTALGEQVIRIEGAKLTEVSNTRFHFYDSEKTYINSVILGTDWANNSFVSGISVPHEVDANGYITYLDVTQYTAQRQSNGTGTTAFVRICGAGIDSNTIVTVNEEITYTTVEDKVVYKWENTGHAFVPADYEDKIVSLEANVEGIEQEIIKIKNNTNTPTSGDAIPLNVVDEVSNLVNRALLRADGNILRFLIYSDVHHTNEYSDVLGGTKELGQAIGEVVNQIGVDFVSGLGDYCWAAYANTTETVKEQIKQFNRFVYPYVKGEQILNCEGNHDDAVYSIIDNDGDGKTSSAEKLSLAETYSLIYSKNKNVIYDVDHYIDGYCYKDFEHLKVRVICLNSEQGTGDGGVIESYQLNWFKDVALNMTGKTDWQVITLAHHPLSYGTTSLKSAVEIVDSFINNGGKYIGHFHGHAHAYSVVKMQKYVNGSYVDINAWEICIPNACYSRNNQYKGNSNERLVRYSTETTYNKSNMDGKRTSFNIITVDLDNKIIYADYYGVGIDRQISY